MNIGLIAHDGKKKLMQNFCIAYRGILNKHELFATATTGRLIEEVTNLTNIWQDHLVENSRWLLRLNIISSIWLFS